MQSIPASLAPDFALVVIGLELSQYGTYSVRSAYSIKKADVDTRLARGSLKRLLPE